MTLKQLEAFYWAATCANFVTAAERLHVSVSSLSKRLVELEASLGCALFDRQGHRAVLTGAGEGLLPKAGQLLAAATDLRASAAASSGLTGRCVFGVGELTALTWLPRLVALARDTHPALTLEPHVDIGARLEERVEKGSLDFAVVAGRSSRSNITSQWLTEARFVWTAASSVVGDARRLTPAMLSRIPLVTLPDGAGTTRILDDWLLTQGVTAEQRLVCNHWGAVAGLLVEGLGLGFLPEGWARSLSRRGQLRILPSTPPLAPLSYAFQWRRDDARPVVSCMRELALKTADFQAVSRLF
jgi:DNA-binding transcriptional LysR family regulator